MKPRSWLHAFSMLLAAVYLLDRLLKMVAVWRFFHRAPPHDPAVWPRVTLIQPVTRASHDLRQTLATRARLDYPGRLELLFVCDKADRASQTIVRELVDAQPNLPVHLLVAAPDAGEIASKIAKLQVALSRATGEILCFVDDDVALRPHSLRVLVPYLDQVGTGAVFGLACYTNWSNLWSSLMSGFVNANALTSYIPLTFLAEPFTITGHCFALRREVFERVGGFSAMEGRIDDDHELARRVRAAGLRCVQTPLVYDVENVLASARAYHIQLRRWFVFPRQTMAPALTKREQAIMALGSTGTFIPSVLLLFAPWGGAARRALLASLGAFAAAYAVGELLYLRRHTPPWRWPLLLIVAVLTPLHAAWALLSGDTIEWRGQRLRIGRDGRFEIV